MPTRVTVIVTVDLWTDRRSTDLLQVLLQQWTDRRSTDLLPGLLQQWTDLKSTDLLPDLLQQRTDLRSTDLLPGLLQQTCLADNCNFLVFTEFWKKICGLLYYWIFIQGFILKTLTWLLTVTLEIDDLIKLSLFTCTFWQQFNCISFSV